MGDQKYKDTHRRMGLCMNCSNPVVPGRIRCEKCLTRERLDSAKKRLERRKLGKCIRCGCPLDEHDDGFVKCVNCREHISGKHVF